MHRYYGKCIKLIIITVLAIRRLVIAMMYFYNGHTFSYDHKGKTNRLTLESIKPVNTLCTNKHTYID